MIPIILINRLLPLYACAEQIIVDFAIFKIYNYIFQIYADVSMFKVGHPGDAGPGCVHGP